MGGSLTENEILTIKKYKPSQIKTFIETGTYKADTTILASKHFEQVHTTEIYEPLYNESKKRAQNENITNITFHLGDSATLLNEILEKIKDENKENKIGFVFFIDAHISGNDSGWNSKVRVPLIDELEVILKYSDKLGPSVFIFDDVRFWKGQTNEAWDWSHITPQIIMKHLIDKDIDINSFYEKNDRFFIFTN
jgi:hypothetical protein